MNNKFPRKLRATLLGAVGTALISTASISYADDTEIFFGGPSIDQGIRPNVLFILDNSGSMNWRTDSNQNPSNNESSRLSILKQAFSGIINNAGAINAGIMVLNPRSAYGNTRMVYPVTYINTPIPSNQTQVASTPEIIDSGDDATQSSNSSSAVINQSTLVMGNISTTSTTTGASNVLLDDNDAFFLLTDSGTDYSCRMDRPNNRPNSAVCKNNDTDVINIRGDVNNSNTSNNIGYRNALLYFRSLGVPATATVTSAYIELRPTVTQTTKPTIRVNMQSSKDPAAMNDSSQLGTRTPNQVANIQASSWNSSQTARLDITQLIQNHLAVSPTGDPLQDLYINLRATNTGTDYTLCARNCGSNNTNGPRVVINYTNTSTTTESRTGALRFQNVGVPQGATIESAHISFAPAASNSDPITFTVQAESANDAATFTSSTNLGSRTKTSAVTTWDLTNTPWVNASPAVHAEGPNVTAQVQEVVSRSGWCGNNAMAFYVQPSSGNGIRTTYSRDGAPGLQPTLTIQYTGGEAGCVNPIFETSVTAAKNDAYEQNGGTVVLGASTLPVDRSRVAARYEGFPVKQGATILDAKVIVTPANTVTSASATTSVRFENVNNSAEFSATSTNLSSRSTTSGTDCVLNSWTTGNAFTCSASGIRDQLQDVVDRSGWAPGNALSVILRQGSDSTLDMVSFEGNPAQSIKLRVKVANGGLISSDYTVRDHLNSLVQSMTAGDTTPIVPTFLEAAKYLRGERTGFASPISSACQPTRLVLLTDGQANGNSDDARNGIASIAGSCTVALDSVNGIVDTSSTDYDEQCGRKLAEALALQDQSTLDGDSYVYTDTIGFALDALGSGSAVPKKFLEDIAGNGRGTTYDANTASELAKAFSDILQSVQDVDTTFVSASAPVNSFERQNNKDELYFSLFKPTKTHAWPGNLKRYRFSEIDDDGNFNPQIVDFNNLPAISGNGFASGARSFWSASADGNNTAQGGAAHALPAPASRKLFTYVGSSPSATSPATLSTTGNLLVNENASITNTMLGATNDTERALLINYIRGLDTSNNARNALGDPVHSSPRLATYTCVTPNADDATKCDASDQLAFFGTNEGFLHAVDTDDGHEVFGFMPQELLENIKKLKENANTTSQSPRPYGMDNPVTLWVNDANGDGKVLENAQATSPQSGEFIYAYATMGRGGRNLYALDVTDRDNPQLRWFIKGGAGGTAGFDKLGQTWSAPIKTRIQVGSTITDVLIFAGGYDLNQDGASVKTADSMGNALYIVDARTGALIWSASSEASNTAATQGHKQLSKMLYSMPANVRVIDLQTSPSGTLTTDANKLADQVIVGDMGGQIWRFYIRNGGSGADLVTPGGTSEDGVFATALPSDYDSLDLLGKQRNLRRFYNEPDVALLRKDGKLTLSVNIGSGYRGHPLNMQAYDRFYSFRTSNLTSPAAPEGTLTESDLLNVTSNLAPTATDQQVLSLSDDRVKGGWVLRLPEGTGEKVLSRSLTVGSSSTVFFNTYEPSTDNNSCDPQFGTSRGYAINLYDATPYYVVGTVSTDDRYSELEVPGLPPNPEIICIGDKCYVIQSPDKIEEVEIPKPGKMYWIDQTDID